jgi:hypothetical protein
MNFFHRVQGLGSGSLDSLDLDDLLASFFNSDADGSSN